MANGLVLLGAGSSGSNGSLTPPSVAPVLTVSADFGSDIANLEWTGSNKTGSSGFGYNIYVNINGAGFNLRDTILGVAFAYDDDNSGAAGETYEYKVIPKNDAGEGPSSNAASVVLPGESSRLLLNAGGNLLLNQTGVLLING